MEIRAEKLEDINGIRQVITAAFGRENEADLVEQLRRVPSTFSFVAVETEQVVGHIFFSPVEIEGECRKDLLILGLAPLAVKPDRQCQGIGSSLIQHALAVCKRSHYQAIAVLGHPTYYPRFGFVTAKQKELGCEYNVPDEVFMMLELETGALQGCRGTIKYRPEFKICE
jgi:putative acetyltransferase